MAEYKEYLLIGKVPDRDECLGTRREPELWKGMRKKLFVFSSPQALVDCVKQMCERGHRNMETFSPTKLNEVEKQLGTGKSPVSYWTLAGVLAGLAAGFLLTTETADVYDLFLGGKGPQSLLPYFLVMFELMILFGALANFISVMYYTGLYKQKIHPWYHPSFAVNKYGLLVGYEPGDEEEIDNLIKPFEPDEEHDQQP
jgi:molybdopterin-containing oxidoreductase family membrane subunit